MPVARLRQLVAHPAAQILGQHLGCGVGDGEQRAVGAREDVGRLAEVVHRDPAAVFVEGQLRIVLGQEDLVVDLVHQLAGDLLQHAEVQDEECLRLDRPFDRHADAVVVPVQGLALVPAEGDEVRGGEDQVVLAHLHPKAARHGSPHVSGSSHPQV
jgi:hypothetical protein